MSQTIVGKIASVSLENFVTYDSVIFYPGEYLNIILGPNGAGKSAIVAGIVLGMGGNCKVLSRCENIDSYIKNGKDSATIRISVYKSHRRDVQRFCRMFDHNRKDTFQIDGTQVSHRAYLEKIRSYNIQIDNLCQFLPQDRVQDFTKMNPRELLLNTQSSVCQPQMNEWFALLKTKRSEQQKSGLTRTNDAEKLRELEVRSGVLEQLLEQNRARQEYEEQIKICMASKLWLEYEHLFRLYNTTKKDQQDASELVRTKEKAYKKCEKEMAAILARKEELQRGITEETTRAQQCTDEINRLEEHTERLEDDIRKRKRELQDALAKAEERRTELEEAKVILSAFIQDCADAANALGSEEQINRQIASFKESEAKVREDYDLHIGRRQELNQKIDNELKPEMMSIQRSIETIENEANNRLRLLEARFEGTYRAVMWLRDNGHRFQGKIYEPMILELNVPVQSNVIFLENTIGIRDLIAFTCEQTEDMNLFLRITREELKIPSVNAIHSAPSDCLLWKPKYPIASLRSFGFHTYLIDTLEGPFPVLNGLCKLYNLHNIPVGGPESAKHVNSLPDVIAIFFTPTNRFQVTKSRYTNEKSTRSDVLQVRNLLNRSKDVKLLDEKRVQLKRLVNQCDKIRNARGEIESRIKELQEKCVHFQNKQRDLQERLGKYQQTKLKVKRQQQKCDQLTQRLINVSEERVKFEQSCKALLKKIVQGQRDKVSALVRYVEAITKYDVLQERLRIYQDENNELEGNLRSVEDAYKSAKKTLDQVQRKFDDLQEQLKRKNVAARALTDGKTPNRPDFPYREQFEALPKELEALEAHLDELRVRFECLPEANLEAAEEYAQKQQQIVQLRAAMARVARDVESLDKEIKETHGQWYPEICRVVQDINRQFSNFMSRMGFAGEVELIRQDEYDYDEYGIRIFVKYRNSEKLCALDRKLQSGGERAVAIAIYTLSLQHLTQVPFRCVDEINQGMDPTNERKVFDMLVAETCREGQSQYFFVTPKLLPRLRYDEKMTINIVHNGKYIESPDVFHTQRA
ncbi:structural maintenance of chromosomes protein 5-like [Anopheles albimanus]|uniref:Structural maintenance of chromosomes protein 5 n=1 Tax=Anopheles albimanus TaxID=7167 RepID=A0A182FBF2_ANOAL|nr:structural maintenance of chromosomes protein 5-like [Anopheles albimanus]